MVLNFHILPVSADSKKGRKEPRPLSSICGNSTLIAIKWLAPLTIRKFMI